MLRAPKKSLQANYSGLIRQKEPVSPWDAKRASISAACGGSQSGSIRSRYQSIESSYMRWDDTVSPRSLPDSASHASRSASDRKPRMLAQVNPTSSQK